MMKIGMTTLLFGKLTFDRVLGIVQDLASLQTVHDRN